MNALRHPDERTVDVLGDAMRAIADEIADLYGDNLSTLEKSEIRLAVRAAIERCVADGYALTRTIYQHRRLRNEQAVKLLTCGDCAYYGRPCLACRRRDRRIADISASRQREFERLRFGKGQ